MEHIKEEPQQKSYATGMLFFSISLALIALLVWKSCGVAAGGKGHSGHKAKAHAENVHPK